MKEMISLLLATKSPEQSNGVVEKVVLEMDEEQLRGLLPSLLSHIPRRFMGKLGPELLAALLEVLISP